MKTPKAPKPKTAKYNSEQGHRAGTGLGVGDFYGSAVKNPVGKMRGDSLGMNPVSSKQLKKPPKSVA
jgi:hypothetical protein